MFVKLRKPLLRTCAINVPIPTRPNVQVRNWSPDASNQKIEAQRLRPCRNQPLWSTNLALRFEPFVPEITLRHRLYHNWSTCTPNRHQDPLRCGIIPHGQQHNKRTLPNSEPTTSIGPTQKHLPQTKSLPQKPTSLAKYVWIQNAKNKDCVITKWLLYTRNSESSAMLNSWACRDLVRNSPRQAGWLSSFWYNIFCRKN